MKKLFFIVNGKAGRGRALKVWETVRKELENSKADFRSFFTEFPGHAEVIAKQIAAMHGERIGAVIAVGGDGTIHEVLNGLADYPDIKIGYIGAGTGNDFSRGYSIPRKPLAALRHIIAKAPGRGRRVDAGQLSTGPTHPPRLFINSAGIGFDAVISKYVNERKSSKFHFFAYITAVLNKVFSYEPSELELIVDGVSHTFDKVWLVAISNQPYYGGGMKIAPSAKYNDGVLNITVVHSLSPYKLLGVFLAVFWGGHLKFKEVSSLSGKDITVKSEKVLPIHTDGEVLGETPVQITAAKNKAAIL